MSFVSILKNNPIMVILFMMITMISEMFQTVTAPISNGQGSTRDITAFVVIAATLFIGAYLLGMFIDVMPALNETNPFFGIMNTIADTISSGYGILVIVLIVIAFVIIMAYLNRIGD